MSIKDKVRFKALLNTLVEATKYIPDKRKKRKITFSIWDTVGSAFGMMFFQDPSMLQFQERMKLKMNTCNLETMFDVKGIPKDKTIRTTLDEIKPSTFSTSFTTIFSNLDETHELEKFKFMGKYLCPIDASQSFSSGSIHCQHCLKKKHKDGSVTYSHQVLAPLIVHPGKKQILPLMPEEIRNEDGTNKQDCELNAAKRLIPKLKRDFKNLSLIVTGDALYANQSFIELCLENQYSFILTAKEGNNKTLFEQIKDNQNIQHKDRITKDKRYEYEWLNDLKLNLSKETIAVNYLAFRIIDIESGAVTYKNSWITDLSIDENNVEALAKGGRSRWKIENECFNVLKNNGYEMEHNYGHGKNYLSFNFFIFTLLSLLFHQIHSLVDEVYQKLRETSGSLKRFWNELKTLIRYILFDSWDMLLEYALAPPEIKYSELKNQNKTLV